MIVVILVTVLGIKNINKRIHDYLNVIPRLKKFTIQEQVTKSICLYNATIMIPPIITPSPNSNTAFPVKPSFSRRQGQVHFLYDFMVLYTFIL